MHIPEGFIAAQTYIPIAIIDVLVWVVIARKISTIDEDRVLAFLALSTAFLLILTSIMIPLVGGTSIHLVGIGISVAVFGFYRASVILSIALGIQALFFGQGGVTTFFVHAFAIAIVGTTVARMCLALFSNKGVGIFLSSFLGVIAASIVVALVLGAQHYFYAPHEGMLFFPYDWGVTLAAIVLPHTVVGLIEGIIALFLVPKLRQKVYA